MRVCYYIDHEDRSNIHKKTEVNSGQGSDHTAGRTPAVIFELCIYSIISVFRNFLEFRGHFFFKPQFLLTTQKPLAQFTII